MNKKEKTILLSKIIILVIPVLVVMLIVNILTFVQPQLDQFNVLHRYDKIYSISDWNLPHIVRELVDDDDKIDIFMYHGCIFLSTMRKSDIPSKRECYDNIVENGKLKGYQLPKTDNKVLNFYLGRKNNTWDMVIYTTGGTKMYTITPQGQIEEKTTPLSLKIDSALYVLSHLYIFLI